MIDSKRISAVNMLNPNSMIKWQLEIDLISSTQSRISYEKSKNIQACKIRTKIFL